MIPTIQAGEIWAVSGGDAATREWYSRIADDDRWEGKTEFLGFARHALAVRQAGGWPQARYYTDNGLGVRQFLSYDCVHEINPFAVRARLPEPRGVFKSRLRRIEALLGLRTLRDCPLIALSNGEMRRVLLARAIAKGPRLLVLDDPAGGLDAGRRERLQDILRSLARDGMAIVVRYRHADEAPAGATGYLAVDGNGIARPALPPSTRTVPAAPRTGDWRRCSAAPAVVEISHLDLVLGRRRLFRDFSWTVRAGEHWLLRGENGCGKTTLCALISGDSPFAYAADVKVFGRARNGGTPIASVRRRIAMVSPELQAYSGLSPEQLLDAALRRRAGLLLLDEPFANMDRPAARKAARRIAAYLREHPRTAAIMISHRTDESPRCFDRELRLRGD